MNLNDIQHECPLCGRYITRPNFNRHYEACKRKHAEKQPDNTEEDKT